MHQHTWALVLAAGEGSRLRTLTTTSSGIAVPKQFCSLQGGPSLLQEALHRAAAVTSRARICTVVAAQHRRWWEGPLWSFDPRNIVVQPRNRGTANGILLPLLHIAQRDPEARVVLLPSDHYVRDEARLAAALNQALHQLDKRTRQLVLMGMEPDDPDPELGYIVPGRGDVSRTLHVRQFIEKPSPTLARALIQEGALWNAFIMLGCVASFVDLYRERYPELLADMQRAVARDHADPMDPLSATELYERLPELDFSRHVLEGAEGRLRVAPVPSCGWSDLGTPARVAQALERTAMLSDATAMHHTSFLNLATQHARLQLA